jgi:hypothetical protein
MKQLSKSFRLLLESDQITTVTGLIMELCGKIQTSVKTEETQKKITEFLKTQSGLSDSKTVITIFAGLLYDIIESGGVAVGETPIQNSSFGSETPVETVIDPSKPDETSDSGNKSEPINNAVDATSIDSQNQNPNDNSEPNVDSASSKDDDIGTPTPKTPEEIRQEKIGQEVEDALLGL